MMSEGTSGASGESLDVQVEEAGHRLRAATEAAEAAEQRAIAEIRVLEADLEKARLSAAEAEEELRLEREAKERAIAAAEGRLAEIEAQAEAAEKRVEAAVADGEARAREAAATWLQGQIESVRRKAGR